VALWALACCGGRRALGAHRAAPMPTAKVPAHLGAILSKRRCRVFRGRVVPPLLALGLMAALSGPVAGAGDEEWKPAPSRVFLDRGLGIRLDSDDRLTMRRRKGSLGICLKMQLRSAGEAGERDRVVSAAPPRPGARSRR
jgi:hypothetical protein